MKRKNTHTESAHPAHPVRNFFYVLWSLLNALAFALGFFVLAAEPFPYSTAVLALCAVTVLLALGFGIIRPLISRK